MIRRLFTSFLAIAQMAGSSAFVAYGTEVASDAFLPV